MKVLKVHVRKLLKEIEEYYDTRTYLGWSKRKRKFVMKRWKN